MKKIALLLCLLTSLSFAVNYDDFFTDNTMRVDFYHAGTATTEIYSVDEIYEEGPWAGSKKNLIDTMNLGKYLVRVYDVQTNQLIYSRGYCTVFGEYQTTGEAMDGITKTYHECVVFPFPKNKVQVTISVRDKNNNFCEQFSTVVDPSSRFVNREQKKYPFKTKKVVDNGKPENKVDIVIIGDGYTDDEQKKFHKDVDRYLEQLFTSPPFSTRKDEFNVWVIDAKSGDSGIDQPRKNIWKDTIVDASYNSLDSPRYILVNDHKALRDIASMVPYDVIYVLTNTARYGGGGIFNWYATCYTGTEPDTPGWWSDYVFVHEFGHSFAGLGDEYYTSDVAYADFYGQGVEPWEPNVTALGDSATLKWNHLVEPGTALPTPWQKAEYDSLSLKKRKLDKKADNYWQKHDGIEELMHNIVHADHIKNVVGAFEGSGYASTGLYRPSTDCRMFSKSTVDFCPVCQEAINKMIDFYTE